MSGLSIADLHKSFGAQHVLRGVDLEVAEGSFVSILGPSGSGKSTLLRVIAGFERADRGSVTLGGVILEDEQHSLAPDRRRVGYVPQEGSLFPHLSVEQNVSFGLPRRERRGSAVYDLLAMVGLDGLGARYPHELSGGQQQRVALARALAIRPSLVLLDEPFSSLDTSLRAAVRQDVHRVLADAGTTALLVTHDQDEALSLSDKVAMIEGGRIGQYDTPVGIYSHPVSPALAHALGSSNLVLGTVRGTTVETALGIHPIEQGASEESASVVVLIRPEQIDLSPSPADGNTTATVVGCEYFGHDAVVRVRGDRHPHPELTIRISDVAMLPDRGTSVGLAVHGSVVVWPASPEPADDGDAPESLPAPGARAN